MFVNFEGVDFFVNVDLNVSIKSICFKMVVLVDYFFVNIVVVVQIK